MEWEEEEGWGTHCVQVEGGGALRSECRQGGYACAMPECLFENSLPLSDCSEADLSRL